MKQDEFNEIVERRLDLCAKTLVRKAREYASAEDRLHNFKAGAEFLDVPPRAYCVALMTKHLISVRDIAFSKYPTHPDVIDEKFGDLINYVILLEAVLKDEC